ncbi:MAG: hypothetical protein Q8O37_00290 [Sulfuricellaceae bacterium]|nr:hypothetical protein [Sulfuricellaceae bacterium]
MQLAVSVELPPTSIVAGVAVTVQTGAVTVTVVLANGLSPLPDDPITL